MTNILRAIPIGASLLLLVSGLAWAENPKSQSVEKQNAAPVAAQGQQAYIDPQTGELRVPTREELRRSIPAQRLNLSRGPAEVIIREDGVRMIELGPAYWPSLQAGINSAGEVEIGHGLGAKANSAPGQE